MPERILSIIAFLVVISFSVTAAAQVVVTGPGIQPQPPLAVVVNPPKNGTVVYTFTNTGSTPVNVTPALTCPPNTVGFEIDSTSFTLAPGQSKQVIAFFAGLPNGAGAGATVSCMINSTVILINLIASPPARSLLKIDISLRPQTTSAEMVQFDIDFETNLDLNIDIGGLLVHSDTGLGVTGTEFQIFELKATLGQVSFLDQFVFATPFNSDRRAIGPLLFVKKRVTATLTINGVTIENLAIFEDVNFPDPNTSTATSYQASDQFFAFGNVLRISAITAGGVFTAFTVGIDADPQLSNCVKKRCFPGVVLPNIVAQTPSQIGVHKLGFTVEKISIQNLAIGGIIFGSEAVFRPNQPLLVTLTMQFSIADLATVTATATLTNILEPQFQSASVVIAAPDIILITTLVAGVGITSHTLIATLTLNSAVTSTLSLTVVPGTGLTRLDANLVIALAMDTRLTSLIRFSGTPVTFQFTQFTLESKVDIIELSVATCISASGLGGGTCGLPGALITAKVRF